jgi:hypothetical protein
MEAAQRLSCAPLQGTPFVGRPHDLAAVIGGCGPDESLMRQHVIGLDSDLE